ncbi:MAG: Ig-like domain-containing protein, partial [Muribaculaceae bacterium]|nr:Ig-like domain-containing protein [Muribaculaceae bacterium]
MAKVWEFVPAPGQFVNTASFLSGDALIGNGDTTGTSVIPSTSGMISLGGFGGYIVVGFDGPVVNDPRNPYGVDFTIGGNAFEAAVKGYWSEPGAVMVMRDDNGNGLPDDTWYELAGSNYWFSTSRRNVTFTYEDPGYASRYYIPYTTSDGINGCVPSNQFHQQSYFPDPSNYSDIKLTDGNKLSLTGTHINAVYDLRAKSYIECFRPLGFGYCDNHATNGDLTVAHNPYYADDNGKVTDGFDIDWAVDADGNYVYLDHIDFIKVYNSVNQQCGWLGESSTEVAAIVMTRPDPNQEAPGDYYLNYAGITQLQVVEGKTCQFEGLAFHNGRPITDATPRWSVEDESIGTIDANGLFTAIKTGATKIHFSATDLAPEDVFDVEVVTLSGVEITREGNASTVSNTEGTALVGEKHFYYTVSLSTNGSTLNGTAANHYIYDTYTWTSSDPSVARIEKNGFFETLKAGETVLTATSDTDPSLSTTFKLTVLDLPEVKQYNNYLVIEDERLSQEELNAKYFTNDQIFIASLVDGRATYKKRVDLALTKVEPEGYDDMFYIENNRLCNRLVKGDWREYRITVEGTLGDVTTTLTFPVLHTSAN